MKHFTTYRFRPLIVLIVIMVGAPVGIYSTYDHEAGNVMNQLTWYLECVENTYIQIGIELKQKNGVLTAYNNYLETVRLSHIKGCGPSGVPAIKSKDEIDAIVDKCDKTGSELANFRARVADALKRVQSIDDNIRNIMTNCHKEPSACADDIKNEQLKLNWFFSTSEKGNIREEGSILMNNKQREVNECFRKKTEKILKDLEAATKEIDDCMVSHDDLPVADNF